jgi:Na+/melibiose symporter-like transporter
MGLIIIFLLIILLIATLPRWSYSKKWGYKYTGVLAIILAILLILIFMKIITLWDIEIETDDGKTEIEIERNY